MSLPKSMLAYTDCKTLYDRAIEAVEAGNYGARVRLPSIRTATHFVMRMNMARATDREMNAKIYSPGDPLYAASVWDSLMVRIKRTGDIIWVYAEPHGIETGEIEEVLDPHEAQSVLSSPPRQLSLPSPETIVQGIRRRV